MCVTHDTQKDLLVSSCCCVLLSRGRCLSDERKDGERIDDKVMTLPMASTESVCGALESYIDLDSSMGTNLYTLVCCASVVYLATL